MVSSAHKGMSPYDVFRYKIAPPILVVVCVTASQIIPQIGSDAKQLLDVSKMCGNSYSWKAVTCFALWALLFLKLPSRKCYGPPSPTNYIPEYQDNGILYYCWTVGAFLVLQNLNPRFSTNIYENMTEILGTLNVVALLFCIFLLIKGKNSPQTPEKLEKLPLMYEFYRGMELHPRFWGCDLKQFINSRLGVMSWQVFILAFFFASMQKHGFNMGLVANLVIQTVYLAKFFWWESGYFNTLDITLDRAGYYICWGCLVWVPSIYTFSSYYLVAHPPVIGTITAIALLIFGVVFTYLNYLVDYEKEVFKKNGGKCMIWGKPAEYIVAEYDTPKGVKKSKLMTSGYWGITRHMNYTFELIATLMWCLPCYGYGLLPFSYLFFLTVLLVHRVFRDEEKCSIKYRTYWDLYCQVVKYRLIPFVF